MSIALRTIDAAASRLGFVSPRLRESAREEHLLLLDSMESGLARASMSMQGYGRIAALARIEGPELDEESLARALVALRRRHRLLRRSVRRTFLGLALGPCRKLSPVSVRTTDDDEGWRSLWAELEAKPLVEGEPLVSLHVLKHRSDPRRADLLLVLEHIVGDGASLVALGREILGLIHPESLAAGATPSEPERFVPTVVTMSADRVGGRARGLVRLARQMAAVAERDRDYPHVRLPRRHGERFHTAETYVAYRDLDEAFRLALEQRARRERCSTATVFVSAVAIAMAEREHRFGERRPTYHVMPHVSVDLRGRYRKPVSHGDLGVHISTVDPHVLVSAEELEGGDPALIFRLARALRAELKELLANGTDRHFLTSLAAGLGMVIPRLAPERSLGSFVFTDAAGFPVPGRLGSFEVRSVGALANCRAHSMPYVVTTRSAERTRLAVMAPTPAFSPADVDYVIERARVHLERALG